MFEYSGPKKLITRPILLIYLYQETLVQKDQDIQLMPRQNNLILLPVVRVSELHWNQAITFLGCL